jgi:hypothetical protein
VTVYGAAFQHPDGSTRLVTDDTGRVVLFGLASLAAMFVVALRLRGADVHVVPLTPLQVADVLLAADISADLDHHLSLV